MSRTKLEKYMNILDNEDFLSDEKQQYYNYLIHAIFDRMPGVEYYE